MASQTLTATLFTNVPGGNAEWITPENAEGSEDVYAFAIYGAFPSDVFSDTLRLTEFGFSIPGGATVNGILIEIERHATTSTGITDFSVRLLKAGTATGDNKASGSAWPTPLDAVASYGGAADLWGTTWSPADCNNGDFGMELVVADMTGSEGAFVDQIQITVFYTEAATPEVLAGQVVRRRKRRAMRRRVLSGDEVFEQPAAPVEFEGDTQGQRRRPRRPMRRRVVAGQEAFGIPLVAPVGLPVLWPVEGDRIVETYGYKTDVMEGYDRTEQRVKLRQLPEESLRFAFVSGSARESGLASGLVYGIQDEVVAVPLWQHGTRLTVPVSVGDSLVSIPDALLVPYLAGEFAVLWVDTFTWELFRVLSVSGSGIAVDGQVQLARAAGTMVYPARRARLADRIGMRWNSSRFLEGEVEFRMEREG